MPRSNSERNQSATEPSRGCPIPRAARTNGNSSSPFGAPTTAASMNTPDRSREIDLRAIDVEHLPQPDHRNTLRAAAREIGEHLRVVPPIIPEEHPPHRRHPVRKLFDSGKLARPAAPDDPSGHEAAARRHQRARRVTITSEKTRHRPSQHLRKGGQVDHPRAAQIRREGADKTGHGQHRTTIAKTGRAQRPKPPQHSTQRPPPEHSIHIENHAMGIAARHHQTPAVTRSTYDVWTRARARGDGVSSLG